MTWRRNRFPTPFGGEPLLSVKGVNKRDLKVFECFGGRR
jgi:hypothetical protein